MTNRPDLDRAAQIAESGFVAPEALDEIGERSALTCPSCNARYGACTAIGPCVIAATQGTHFPPCRSTKLQLKVPTTPSGRHSRRP
jgi:hypothetical protein